MQFDIAIARRTLKALLQNLEQALKSGLTVERMHEIDDQIQSIVHDLDNLHSYIRTEQGK